MLSYKILFRVLSQLFLLKIDARHSLGGNVLTDLNTTKVNYSTQTFKPIYQPLSVDSVTETTNVNVLDDQTTTKNRIPTFKPIYQPLNVDSVTEIMNVHVLTDQHTTQRSTPTFEPGAYLTATPATLATPGNPAKMVKTLKF